MKRNILFILSLVAAVTMQALPITKGQAEKNVRTFLTGKSNRMFSTGQLKLTAVDNGDQPYYIFNIGDNNGFVIASGEDAASDILGYSYEGHFDKNNVPTNMKLWLEGYAREIKQVQKLNLPPKPEVRTTENNHKPYIPVLLTTKWNQGDPYNIYCPSFGTEFRCPTGCVATAFAQVMYYHKWPVSEVPEVPGYSYADLITKETRTIDPMPATTFKWDLMEDYYDNNSSQESKEAVAELMAYCGRSMEMNYNKDGSFPPAANLEGLYMDLFGYNKSAQLLSRDSYESQEKWEEVIYNELKNKRPVLYSGANETAGHEFVCDGYDEGYFHINWGWGGSSDGFFKLTALDPSNQGIGGSSTGQGFNLGQLAVIGIMKPNGIERLYSNAVSQVKGSDADAVISMFSYEEKFTSLQFDVEMPAGLDIVTDESGNPVVTTDMNRFHQTNHVVNANKISEGLYRVVVYSTSNTCIKGTDGPVLAIRLKTSVANVGLYNMVVKNIKMCDADLNTETCNDIQISVDVRNADDNALGWYSYFQGDYSSRRNLGVSMSHYDCAIVIPADDFMKGKYIRAIMFAMNNVDNISNVKVWMSTNLPKSAELADICYQNIDKSLLRSLDEDMSTNNIFFDQPYQIKDNNVYIGYSFDTKLLTDKDNRPVVVVGNDTYEGGFWLSCTGEDWTNFAGQQFGNLGIMAFVDDNAPYIQGDVNYDTIVDQADADALVSYIFNSVTGAFNDRAADVNKSSSVNITDAVSVIEIMLERYKAPDDNKAPGSDDLVSASLSNDGIDIVLTGNSMYRAMQMDVVIDTGVGFDSVIPGEMLKDCDIKVGMISDGIYRITAYSKSGLDFTEKSGRLFTIVTENQEIKLQNIIFVTPEIQERYFADVTEIDVTGITEVEEAEVENSVYTIDGKKLNSNVDNLDKGVYIINGKKVIVK